MGDTTISRDLSRLYALPVGHGATVRGRRYLLDEPMDIDVPLDVDGTPLFVFSPFPEIGVSSAFETRRALDDALEGSAPAGEPSAAVSLCLSEHVAALQRPMTLPYWLIQLPSEAGGILTAVCLLHQLALVADERVYGMSNGWALHLYPPVRRRWVRGNSPAPLRLRALD